MTGGRPARPATRGSDRKGTPDYARFLDPAGLSGARIGVAREYFEFNDRVARVVDEAIAANRSSTA